MSALWRAAVCSLPFAASLMVAWEWINGHVAQGAPAFGPSVVGLLLWLWMFTMASIPVAIGGALAGVVAVALRLRAPTVVPVGTDRWMSFAVPMLFFAAGWAAWAVMWELDRPAATRYEGYGTSYFWMMGLLGATWAVPFGAAAWYFLSNDARPRGNEVSP